MNSRTLLLVIVAVVVVIAAIALYFITRSEPTVMPTGEAPATMAPEAPAAPETATPATPENSGGTRDGDAGTLDPRAFNAGNTGDGNSGDAPSVANSGRRHHDGGTARREMAGA